MAVTETFNVLSIVTAALRKIGVVAGDEAASADDTAHAIEALNWMLKAWQANEWLPWTYTSGTLTLTTAASYTLSPARPLRILNARLKRSGIEIPMQEMSRDEYDRLPQKTSTGLPTSYHYDRQREAAVFYVWPVLATAAGETVEYTYERELEDIAASTDTLDMPVEWHECVVYNLAARLADDYEVAADRVVARAEMMLDKLLAHAHEGSLFFRDYDA